MQYYISIISILFVIHLSNAQTNTLIINEILASNTSINRNETGNYEDWLEIYNNTNTHINLEGYYFTNSAENPQKYQIKSDVIIAPKTYRIIWADNLDTIINFAIHVNFKISKKGGELAIFHPDGKTLVDHRTFGIQYPDYSFGRNIANEWQFFNQPTPNRKNDKLGKDAPLSAVEASLKSGYYQKQVRLKLYSNDKNARIYYTTDGSEPNDSSDIYQKPLQINKTTTVKAIVLTESNYQSTVASFFYHIDNLEPSLPIVHISLPKENFEEIYGKKNVCNLDCSRKATFTYIDENGNLAFESTTGIQISGQSSRNNEQQSIKISFRKKFDSKNIKYNLFNKGTHYPIHTLLLRNSGNSWNQSFINDVLIQSFASELNIDYQAWQPVIVYVNGEYWGIYHLREKINTRHLQYHHSLKSKKLDMIDENFKALEGDSKSYIKLIQFAKENDLNETKNYQKVISQIDLESYIDYFSLQIYFANNDWTRRNIKVWKSEETEKWRWILFDTDLGFSLSGQNFIKRAMGEITFISPEFEQNSVLFNALMANTDFKKAFVNRLKFHMDSTFSAQNIIAKIDSIENLLRPVMPKHLNRWKHQCDETGCIYKAETEGEGMEVWLKHLENLRMFAKKRREKVLKDILEIQ